jgi:hypothetical protein
MLAILDEAIADLRAASGSRSFDFTLVASNEPPPPPMPLLPRPTLQETIQGTLMAAAVTSNPAERLSLLSVALNVIDARAIDLPADWFAATRANTVAQIEAETAIDRSYRELSDRVRRSVATRATNADVRGIQRMLKDIEASDAALGSKRPDAIAALVADVEVQLDAARRLRLARDRWALKEPELKAYRSRLALTLARFRRMTPSLEDIKALSGSAPEALGTILTLTQRMQLSLGAIAPPPDLADVHNMFVSAAQLAANAALIRREAAIHDNMPRAWDASSAAAGALMLVARARDGLTAALRPPQYVR